MCSQNGNQGMGKLVAKPSSDQGLGGRACGLAQEGTVHGACGVRGTAWAVCGHGGEVPVAGAAVQGCSSAGVSLQCRGAALPAPPLQQQGGHWHGVGTQCVPCPRLEWEGMGRNSVSAARKGTGAAGAGCGVA